MPKVVADYAVVHEGKFKLDVGENKRLDIELPPEARVEDQRAVLLFSAVVDNVEELHLSIQVNDQPKDVYKLTVSGENLPVFATLHAVISRNLLRAGRANHIVFRASGMLDDAIQVADAVLMYQREI